MSTYAEKELHRLIETLSSDLDTGEKIATLKKIIEAAEEVIGSEVAAARVGGWSWGELAPVLGTTRQAAQQRYGNKN